MDTTITAEHKAEMYDRLVAEITEMNRAIVPVPRALTSSGKLSEIAAHVGTLNAEIASTDRQCAHMRGTIAHLRAIPS